MEHKNEIGGGGGGEGNPSNFEKYAVYLDFHGRHGRHFMLSYLSSLPISVLPSLDTEAKNFTIELTDYLMQLYLQGVILNFNMFIILSQ